MGETKKKKAEDKNGRAAKKDAEFKALQKKRDEDFARNAAEQGKPAVDRDSLKNTRAADLNDAALKARQDAVDPNRPGFTSKPEDVAKGGGSKLDHFDNYQASEFGSATPGERAQQDRMELNKQMHDTKRKEGAARARYRYLRRHPKKGDAAAFLDKMKDEGVNLGMRLHGERAVEADKDLAQQRKHEIKDGRRLDPKGDFFQRNIKPGDLANFKDKDEEVAADPNADPNADPDKKSVVGASPEDPGGGADTGAGPALASIANENKSDSSKGPHVDDEALTYDNDVQLSKDSGDAPHAGEPGEAGGGKNKFAGLIDEIGEKQFEEELGGDYGPPSSRLSLSSKDRTAFRKELLTISEGIKDDPNFFRNNKSHIKTLFESLDIDEDKGKNVLRQHNKFQQVHKKDPVPKYLRPGQSRKPAHSNPFTPFSARTHKMVESGKRTPAQEPKGGWDYKNRPTTIKRDQDRLMSNAAKTFATDDKEVNESFAAVRNMLTKSVLKKETSNHYAAQYRADLVDTYNDYSRLKGLGLDKDIPSPPTEKGIRENPESLNEWISKVGQAKLDQRPWDPKGQGYDMKTAKAHGMTADKTGHWASRSPKTGQILKGSGHETYGKTEKGEAEAGHTIYQDPNSGKNYSHPARKMSDRPNIKNPNSPKSDLKNFKPKPKPKNPRTRRRR